MFAGFSFRSHSPPTLFSILLCTGLGVLLYGSVLGFNYIWDDLIIRQNLGYFETRDILAKAFGEAFLGDNYYRPIPVLSMILEVRVGDRFQGPYYGHLLNLTLFLASCAMLVLISHRVAAGLGESAQRWSALFAGLLFLTHPVLMVGPAWVSARFDLLLVFFTLALLLFDLSVRDKYLRAVGVGMLFLAAALSKEAAIAVACALPFWHLLVYRQRWAGLKEYYRWTVREQHLQVYLAVFAAGCLYLAMRYYFLGYILLPEEGGGLIVGESIGAHALYVGKTFARYLVLIAIPFSSIAPGYPQVIPVGSGDMMAVFGCGGLLLCIVVGLFIKKPAAIKWTLFILLCLLLPVLNLKRLSISDNIVNLRFAMLPVTWLIIIFALWLASTMRDGVSKIVPKYLLPVLTAWMLVGALTVKTTLPLWHSDTSFWRWYALVAPEARLAYANYSMALQQSDQFALSIEYGAASIAQYPELGPTAYLASGISLIRSGQATTGIALLEQAGRFALSAQLQARVQGHIGEAYIDLENYVAAAAVLEAALELDPRGLVAHLQLARLYSKTGNAAGVHKHFAAVTAITDGNADIARALFEEAGISL